jgi:hypothetical protein
MREPARPRVGANGADQGSSSIACDPGGTTGINPCTYNHRPLCTSACPKYRHLSANNHNMGNKLSIASSTFCDRLWQEIHRKA